MTNYTKEQKEQLTWIENNHGFIVVIDNRVYWEVDGKELSDDDVDLVTAHYEAIRLINEKYPLYGDAENGAEVIEWDDTTGWGRDGGGIDALVQLPSGYVIRMSPQYVCGQFSEADTDLFDSEVIVKPRLPRRERKGEHRHDANRQR